MLDQKSRRPKNNRNEQAGWRMIPPLKQGAPFRGLEAICRAGCSTLLHPNGLFYLHLVFSAFNPYSFVHLFSVEALERVMNYRKGATV